MGPKIIIFRYYKKKIIDYGSEKYIFKAYDDTLADGTQLVLLNLGR